VEICLDRVRRSGRRITYFEAGVRDVEQPGEPMQERDPHERHQNFDREVSSRRHLERMRMAYLAAARRGKAIHVIENSAYIDEVVAKIVSHIDERRGVA
jgi:thymidylate kinase